MTAPQQVSTYLQCITVLFISALNLEWASHGCAPRGADGFKIPAPEFAGPLKNISVPAGSNIELFCNVRNLGATRIMWLKKEEDKQVLLAINTLLITNNPRVTVSLLTSSGDVSQSILYIYAVEHQDQGTYHCIVNSNPAIFQAGLLEVKQLLSTDAGNPSDGQVRVSVTSAPETSTTVVIERNEMSTGPTPFTCNTSVCQSNIGLPASSQVLCIDLQGLWSQTRHGARYLLSWIYKCLDLLF